MIDRPLTGAEERCLDLIRRHPGRGFSRQAWADWCAVDVSYVPRMFEALTERGLIVERYPGAFDPVYDHRV